LAGVEVRHNERAVLRLPDLTVARGEVLAVVGPNGAGKSTLLQIAALLRAPDSGDVWIGDERAERRSGNRLRRRLAVVFQDPLLFDRSVMQNATSGLRFRGVGHREAEERARRWLDRFGVGHLATRSARSLSGGEAQRVALARAFALEPDLLLLDEPFAAVDAPTRAELVPEVAARLRETGTAAIVVTHNQEEAMALGDRLAVLLAGEMAQSGSPAHVLSAPASVAVARFLGVANLLPGRVVGRDRGIIVAALAPTGVVIQVATGNNGASTPDLTETVSAGAGRGGRRGESSATLLERFSLEARGSDTALGGDQTPAAALAVGAAIFVALHANAISVIEGEAPPGWNVLRGVVIEATTRPAGIRLRVDCGVSVVVTAPFQSGTANPTLGSTISLAFPPEAGHCILCAPRTSAIPNGRLPDPSLTHSGR